MYRECSQRDSECRLPQKIVNAGFRKGECGFLQMADIIEETMAKATFDSNPDLDVYLQTDAEARRIATDLDVYLQTDAEARRIATELMFK